jgi:peptidoglycan-associated lipoprotein
MTASRHVSRGVKALGGKQGDSQMVASHEEFAGRPTRDDFIPLHEDSGYRQLTMGDTTALEEISLTASLPQPKESPGDPGSRIPGIDGFSDPSQDPALSGIFRNLRFPYNSSLIKGQESLDTLHRIVSYLDAHPQAHLFIEGHCDERGAQAYNLALGTRRANAVRTYLVKQGIDPERIYTISYGKERPVAMGHDEKAWSENRRGQFRIYQNRGRG